MMKMKLRNELKYHIAYFDYVKLRNILKATMMMDDHSGEEGYFIRSLYFDDIWDSALYEKNAGVLNRKKFRIRIYNYSDQVIKLERKRKYNQNTNKEDFSLTRVMFDDIMRGDVGALIGVKDNVANEFFAEYKSKWLRPKVLVDYTREAYIMKAGNVRITFDKKLSASSNIGEMFADTVGRPMMPDNQLILEVKYDDFLPEIIKQLLSNVDKKPLSISKYVMCREALINNDWGLK
ncbi:polyphosphate polymerase domain-containing protein [Fusibacter ferrireducens]|uniref:Polyphosphate polymerase domain-containing protein n=1 Tax=Fusibacter ferrireducens TaxID=2785058 RepID=A0ABR9ZUQ7_9FIRM|nr:polyphosphate polymerase domain-containing protein [Fusibacter ferrireducens]MBF4694198.1 polyphosphate polymerase domain-containing protein [Fusibacter ferrireducens]